MNKLTFLLCIFILYGTECQRPGLNELDADICIYGGTSAGIIAAYSAALTGKKVILVEPGLRLGGLTTGGLGQTDIGNKFAVTGLAKNFYRRIGSEYGKLEQWKFEPSVALKVYQDYLNETDVQILYDHRLNRVIKSKKSIELICLEKSSDPLGPKTFIRAKQYIDCTYEGDLMAHSDISFTIGRESNATYSETYNGVQLRGEHQFPDNIDPYVVRGDSASGLLWGVSAKELLQRGSGDKSVQAYNFRICLTDSAENMIPVTKPDNYDSSKYELLLRLIEKTNSKTIHNHFIWSPMPNRKTDINNKGGFSTDMIGMNYRYPDADYKKRDQIIHAHKAYTLGLLYFIGHDERVPVEMRNEMLQWGYPKDEFIEFDHFTPQLYVREARRMIGEYVMTEANCVGEKVVKDAIGMAAYTMDSHNCQRLVVNGMVKNEGDVQIGGFPPYPIAYRSITPKREECTNLLVPVDLSASHIAYGSIRMEPVFMVLGQVAAIAAGMAIDDSTVVQKIDLKKLQDILINDPLLNGSKPEIIIDNSESDKISFSESIQLENTAWEDKAYKQNYLLSSDSDEMTERIIRFNLQVNEAGLYKVYYYCPSIFHKSGSGKVLGQLPLTIKSDENKVLVKIPFAKSAASWAYCGEFALSPSNENYLEVDQSGKKGSFAADALLLIPQN